MKSLSSYSDNEYFIFVFENGKAVKIPLSAYETKGNRKKLTAAYSSNSPIVACFYENKPFELMFVSENKKAITISTKLIPIKTTRSSQGVTVFDLKKKDKIISVQKVEEDNLSAKNYKKIKIPAIGKLLDEFDIDKQQIKLV